MTYRFKNIFIFLLAAVSALSCSKAILADGSADIADGSGKVIINGTVSEKQGLIPLEGIKVTFTASQNSRSANSPIIQKHGYSDSQGKFSIEAEGFSTPLRCSITAEDQDGIYKGSGTTIDITWNGPTYDSARKTYIVNDCDLYLEKK